MAFDEREPEPEHPHEHQHQHQHEYENENEHQPASGSGLYASSAAATQQRSARRRKQVVAGVAGAAAVLAGAGFLLAELMNEDRPTFPEPAALAPLTTAATTEPGPGETEPSVARTPRVTRQAAPVERSPVPSPAPSREASPDPGLARPSTALDELRERLGADERRQIMDRTEQLGAGTIRIVSARRDLTGERQMLLAGDEGREVGGGVRCTTAIRYEPALPSTAPATLMCWRTSTDRSVITMASTPEGTPPDEESIDAIGREWARLG